MVKVNGELLIMKHDGVHNLMYSLPRCGIPGS